jgi:hypothetical protein
MAAELVFDFLALGARRFMAIWLTYWVSSGLKHDRGAMPPRIPVFMANVIV